MNSSLEFKNSINPWRRFWARYFDYFTHSLAIGIVWAVIDLESLEKIHNAVLSFLLMIIYITLDGIYMAYFGTTLGKKLMKIKVVTDDGNRISKYMAFKRTRLVWLRGMGLGIGIIEFIANIYGYIGLKKEGKTSWDNDLGLTVRGERIGIIGRLICPVFVIGFIFLTIYSFI